MNIKENLKKERFSVAFCDCLCYHKENGILREEKLMQGSVTRLYLPENVDIPEDMLTLSVSDKDVEEDVMRLALRYSKFTEVSSVEFGDVVYCAADAESYPDGREILLYTSVEIPGAKDAAKAVVGKKVGDVFVTLISEKPVTLTVKKAVRPIPATVDDALIKSMGIDGVSTVDAYRALVKEKKLADMKTEKTKIAVSYVFSRAMEESVFEYDEAEMKKHVEENMNVIIEEYRAEGIELSEEEVREGLCEQEKQTWFAVEYCKEKGIAADEDFAREEAARMIEMAELSGETVPDREAVENEMIITATVTEAFKSIEAMVSEKIGG